MTIFFRADGNPIIGTGHIMRCLSLADAFLEQGVDSVFLIAETYMQPLIQKRGYQCHVLGTTYDRMEEELPVLFPLLAGENPSCVILDSYFVTSDYMSDIKSRIPLVYIDDLNTFDCPADVVVNCNIYGSEVLYPQNKLYFTGPKYIPLRKQFQGLKPRVSKEPVEQVLLSTGGTDQYHVALRCVEYLLAQRPDSNVTYHFVLGDMNRDADQIKEMVKHVPYIVPHQQVTNMCALMQQCDVAVSAAGTTLFELCACGLPTVTYVLADNQIMNAASFAEKGLMLHAGDVRREEHFAEKIFDLLNTLVCNASLRQTIEQQMQRLIDGNGAGRLAANLCDMLFNTNL